MPLLRYNEIFCAQEHEFGITAVAFSSQNTLLATAGLDGKVCLWDVRTHALLHTYKNDTAIVCMDWKSQSEDTLVIGYQDGNVATLSLTAGMLNLSGFFAHDSSVDCIASHGELVATAARDEVRIWEWRPCAPWKLLIALPGPPKISENVSLEVLVVNVHWTSWTHHQSALLVSYQNHGILMYDALTWQSVHALPIRDPISRVSLAPDGEHIAVYNMAKGVEVRSLSDGTVRCAFPPDSGEKHLLPVNFVHGGGGVVVGATDGNVGVWDLRYSIKIQDLPHPKQEKVLALAATYDQQADRYLIITGSYTGSKGPAAVRWWIADETRTDGSQAGASSSLHFGWTKGVEPVWLTYAFIAGALVSILIVHMSQTVLH